MSRVAEAFTRKAEVYDAFGKGHPHLAWLRERVYTAVEAAVPAGGHLLEINAGTGWDAAQLVGRGFRVHATDLAPGMVAAARAKLQAGKLHEAMSVQRLSFTALDQARGGPYDAVLSNFGGLNCTPDLHAVTRHLPGVLKPGGVVIWVVMPPLCPWELLLTVKDPAVGLRRLRRGGAQSHVEGVYFTTYYYTPAQVMRAFPPGFEPLSVEGLGLFTPPADNKTFARRHPRLYAALQQAEMSARRLPLLRGMGDFFILTMRYAPV